MLADGRTLREVLLTSEAVYGRAESTAERANNYVLTLAALKDIPGPFLSDEKRAEIKRAAVRVVRGGAK